jgi:hypothetical protein
LSEDLRQATEKQSEVEKLREIEIQAKESLQSECQALSDEKLSLEVRKAELS